MSYAAFGTLVPTPKGNVDVTLKLPNCGTLAGMQQMLADLGYYTAKVDGIDGKNTQNAIVAFAKSQGLNVSSGLTVEFCKKLAEAWLAKTAGTAPSGGGSSGSSSGGSSSGSSSSGSGSSSSGGGSGSSTTGGSSDGAKAWWAGQSTAAKVGIVAGSSALLIFTGVILFGGSPKAEPVLAKS